MHGDTCSNRHTHVNTHTHTHTRTCKHICTHTYTHVNTYVHTHIHVNTSPLVHLEHLRHFRVEVQSTFQIGVL